MKKLFLVVISSILFAFNANAADMRIKYHSKKDLNQLI